MEQYYDLFLSSPLFIEMDREEIGSMLNCLGAKKQAFSRGEPVFLEGDPAGSIGMVLEGSVQVVQDDFFGNRSLLTHVERGELFAEAFACANTEALPVSVYAVEDSVVLLMNCRKMLTVCSSVCRFHNQLVKNLLQVVAAKTLTLSSKIRLMSKKTTREKLMSYLLEQAKNRGREEFSIPLNRQALADYLGVERSAMSAELSKMRKEGLLEFRGSHFQLKPIS